MQTQINIVFLIMASALFALLMIAFVTFFLFITQKRSFRYNENLLLIKKEYDSAILNSQIEVQANTLQEVSDEIHDNIGQLLSVTKMNLAKLTKHSPLETQPLAEETNGILSEIIGELRHISKSISPRQITDFGLAEAIGYQINRINKAGDINAELIINGEPKSYNPPVELVIFRIVQELMNNSIKHSECNKITVSLLYEDDKINIEVNDDGKGFNRETTKESSGFKDGTGLHSLENKAKTINCSIAFNSGSKGTYVTLVKNFKNEIY